MGRYPDPHLEIMTKSKPKHVLIVGAGFAGLAAAIELNKEGVQTTLCERQSSAVDFRRLLNLPAYDSNWARIFILTRIKK